jgi:hypothetical protein
VVRRALPEGGYSDAVGPLIEASADHVVIETKRGLIRIEAETIAVGKIVGPPRGRGN